MRFLIRRNLLQPGAIETKVRQLFSFKTAELINCRDRYTVYKKSCAVFTSKTDKSKRDEGACSHDGISTEAIRAIWLEVVFSKNVQHYVSGELNGGGHFIDCWSKQALNTNCASL